MKLRKLGGILLTAIFIATALCCLVACNPQENPNTPSITSDSLYVKKVEDISDDFILGMDSSCVPALEKAGVKYYDFDGNEADVFKILADNGVNTIRVRVWNNPFDDDGNGFGGGNCDINNAVEIGKRATQYGLKLMVDFHYSDFWADPAKQTVPRAWAGMNIDEKAEALYQYTKECLELLKKEGVAVGSVQVGNETNGKMCGETQWFKMSSLFEAGSKAVREVYPEALVVLHFANPEKVTNYKDYASKLAYYEIDYDVFASSYYPYWHGTLENLSSLLGEIAETYNKKVMVAETSYAFSTDDFDLGGNTIGAGASKNYPFTVQGQANCVRDVIDTIAHTTNGIGVCYWEGTWISSGGADYEANKALWEQYGTGWAAEAAKIYDEDVKLYGGGGTQVDNQAFFTTDGKPLESLKVFALARTGNVVENKADALEEINMICDLNGTIRLPEQVNAVMLDNSKQAIDVTWNITQSDIDKMYSGGVKKYEITGTAGGMTTTCYLSMVEYNFINNYSFEEDANKTKVPTGWTVTDHKSCNELWVEEKSTDSLTGTHQFHFWASGTDSVEFELEQELTNLEAGKYKYSISIMGGDGGNTEIYAYVKINGEIVKTAELSISSYGNWDTATIQDIQYNGTDKIVVGIYVKCGGTGAGAWGKIDDALFNSVAE